MSNCRKKQVGTSENGDPIFNEYAICRDCKKQWNLDKQRAKKMAARKAAEEKMAEPAGKAAGNQLFTLLKKQKQTPHPEKSLYLPTAVPQSR